ncbi:bifunctional fucokinase/fucose pyrophosphorylase-like, partial [Trifolium medium]|nr:bifunctional fucokinase/fucose pyrophosphorylase-like [Trifolium medium]
MSFYVDTVDASLRTTHEWLRKYPSSEEPVIELGRQSKFSYCTYGLLCLHMVAIQNNLNQKFKGQGLPSIVTSDFNQYFIGKVGNEPFQLQRDSMINSIASSPNSNFLRKMIPRGQLLLWKHLQIFRGSVIITKIMLKWRDLP